MTRSCWDGNDVDGYLDVDDLQKFKLAMFDARVFTIPMDIEVENYFIWRQQDATRNSISSVAQSLYNHKELHGKTTRVMQEMIFQKGTNWNDYTPREKRGSVIHRVEKKFVQKDKSHSLIGSDGLHQTQAIDESRIYTRNVWEADPETPIFTQDREYLRKFIPKQEN